LSECRDYSSVLASIDKLRHVLDDRYLQTKSIIQKDRRDSMDETSESTPLINTGVSWLSKSSLLIIITALYFGVGMFWFLIVNNFKFVDSVYTIVIIFTTVGYGIDVQENSADQWFLIFYTIWGVSILGTGVSVMFDGFLEKLSDKQSHKFMQTENCESGIVRQDSEPNTSTLKWLMSLNAFPLMMWLLYLVIGAAVLAEVEGWSFQSAVYFAVISGSTVGFGDFSPQSTTGKVITIFYLPTLIMATGYAFSIMFSTAIEAFVDETYHELMKLENKMDTILHSGNHASMIDLLDADGDGKVREEEYMLQVLINHFNVSDDVLRRIKAKFYALDKDGDGHLDTEDFCFG